MVGCFLRSASMSNDELDTFPPPSLRQPLATVASLLKERKQTISVAETAAGGLISAALLSVPGASAYYKGGLTLYTLESRIAFGGWTEDNLKDYKGPTTEIVAGLATHVRKTLNTSFTISESGTAGPTGGTTRNRTPGYVALAIAFEHGVHTKEVDTGKTDRNKNMIAFAEEALKFLAEVLTGSGKEGGPNL